MLVDSVKLSMSLRMMPNFVIAVMTVDGVTKEQSLIKTVFDPSFFCGGMMSCFVALNFNN